MKMAYSTVIAKHKVYLKSISSISIGIELFANNYIDKGWFWHILILVLHINLKQISVLSYYL